MVFVFFILSLLSAFLSFLSLDPMKSSLFLVFSLVFLLPLISFSLHVWYSYYICLLYLSGIFVVIVYFSSISSFSYYKMGWFLLVLLGFMLIFMDYSGFLVYYSKSSLDLMVSDLIWFVYFWLVMVLFLFLGFISYFLTFEGALRKV